MRFLPGKRAFKPFACSSDHDLVFSQPGHLLQKPPSSHKQHTVLSQHNVIYIQNPILLLQQTPNVFPRSGTSNLPVFVGKARPSSLNYPGKAKEGGGRAGRKD